MIDCSIVISTAKTVQRNSTVYNYSFELEEKTLQQLETCLTGKLTSSALDKAVETWMSCSMAEKDGRDMGFMSRILYGHIGHNVEITRV